MISYVKMDRFCKFTEWKILEHANFFCYDALVTFNVNPVSQNIFKISNKNTETMTQWVFLCPKLALLVKPSLVDALFLYPLKTPENQRFSDVFRGYRKRPVA